LNHDHVDEGEITARQLAVSGGEAAAVLEPSDASLDVIPTSVCLAAEEPRSPV
jgi:hypothetical protein